VKQPESAFVDTGAWLALALVRDPHHDRAREAWERLVEGGSRMVTSVPVVIETFTFLDRNTTRQVALAWKASLGSVRRLTVLPCAAADLDAAWAYFEKAEFHKLSAVDAVSFVLMKQQRIRTAFAFDVHFTVAGFRVVG
jgi:predicted nucleic acid-binding protein